MDGAFGGDLDTGEPPDQALSDLTGAPAGVLALHVQDIVLHLNNQRSAGSARYRGLLAGTDFSIGGVRANLQSGAQARQTAGILRRCSLHALFGKLCNTWIGGR